MCGESTRPSHSQKGLGTFPNLPCSFLGLLSQEKPHGLKLETQVSSPACTRHLMSHLVPFLMHQSLQPHCVDLTQATIQSFAASSLVSQPPCLHPYSSNPSLL